MKAEQSTRSTTVTQKGKPWEWREGQLRHGEGSAGWDAWTLVAIVGREPEGLANVQFVMDKSDTGNSKMLQEAAKELNFYLAELREEDPWRYLQYHCTTMADVYSSAHWSFITANVGRPDKEKHHK